MKQFWKSGDPFIWLTGAALTTCLVMIAALGLLILLNGVSQFWPSHLVRLHLRDGQSILGEIWNREEIPSMATGSMTEAQHRVRLKIGNRDLYSLDFKWVDESEIISQDMPRDALAIEREEWGNFYGFFKNLRVDGRVEATDLDAARPLMGQLLDQMEALHRRIRTIEVDDIGEINYDLERLRLDIRRIALSSDTTQSDVRQAIAAKHAKMADLRETYAQKENDLQKLYKQSEKVTMTVASVDGREKEVKLFNIVRLIEPNNLGIWGKCLVYASKVAEFITGEPRESNTEGGIFPAIFGTVMLVVIMTIAVVPLGVLAAIYLREYAKQGFWVRAIRIAVNNLAGVPSIVYGIFGLGFFVYAIGGSIDQLFFAESLPTPTFGTGGILWASLTLALLTVPVVIVATEEGLAAVPNEIREGSLALAATKFETLWHVVIPSAMPGILTGVILAVARAAGEVAPLMITGVVKLAPSLPLDGRFPFLHLERKFMHLGFHIYDVGFQSPNVEAAIPMVYSTTLLLLLIVIFLNVFAIHIRNRLRKKFTYSVF